MEQSFAERGDGEEQTDTKDGCVHSTDKEQRPSRICLYRVIWALAYAKISSSERIDALSWNKVCRQRLWRGVDRE